MPPASEITLLLNSITEGDDAQSGRLWELMYPELRKIARHHLSNEKSGHTLQPTALVNEAFLKLANQKSVQWQGRSHFLRVSAVIMRRVLVDYARNRNRDKRGGGLTRVQFNDDLIGKEIATEDILAIDAAVTKLTHLDQRQGTILELRFFAGLTVPEVAETLKLSTRLIESEWQLARAWMRRELSQQ